MDRVPLHTIPALLEEVEHDLVDEQIMTRDRLKDLLETKRNLLLALKEALEERDQLRRRDDHEYH